MSPAHRPRKAPSGASWRAPVAVEANEDLAARHKDWITRAKHALDVPGALGDVTRFIADPALLYTWRKELADTIEAAPVKAAEL